MEHPFQQVLAGTSPLTILLLVLWMLPWKAWALWLSARRGDFWWFLIFIVMGTFGVLEIVYIFFIAKQSDTPGAALDA